MPLEQNSEEKLAEQLDQLIQSIDESGRAILPNSNDALLKSIVECAGRIFNAQAASLLLVLEQEQVLEFKVSYGFRNVLKPRASSSPQYQNSIDRLNSMLFMLSFFFE